MLLSTQGGDNKTNIGIPLHTSCAKENMFTPAVVGGSPRREDEGGEGFYSPSTETEEGGSTSLPSTRLMFGERREGGGSFYARQCASEEHRDKMVNMGFGCKSAEEHFDAKNLSTIMHTGVPGYDFDTHIIPELAKAGHYGDKIHASYNAKLVPDEMQELFLMATYYNRFINESIRMSPQFFPSSDSIRSRLAKSVERMEGLKKKVTDCLTKLTKEGRDIEVIALQAMLEMIEDHFQIQTTSFQHHSAVALNVQRILEPVSRMLTSLRNLMAKMPSVMLLKEEIPDTGGVMPAEIPTPTVVKRDVSPVKMTVTIPKSIAACSEEQRKFVEGVAVSLGRDAASSGAAGKYENRKVDPFDIGLKCPTGISLPPISEKLKSSMTQEQRDFFDIDVKIYSIEQGILLLESRYQRDGKAWELALEWPKVTQKNDPPDMWRFLVLDGTQGEVGKKLWVEEREQQLRLLFGKWLETNDMTLAVYQLLLAIQKKVDPQLWEKLEELPFIYTGLPYEFWSVGWLKNRTAHKIPNLWRYEQNLLGNQIKEKVLRSKNEFLAYQESHKDLDESTERGAQWKMLTRLAEERENVWFIETDDRFQEAKSRIGARVVALQERKAADTFVASINNQLRKGKIPALGRQSHIFYPFKGQKGGKDDRQDEGRSRPLQKKPAFETASASRTSSGSRGGIPFGEENRGRDRGGYYYYQSEDPSARYAEQLYRDRHPEQQYLPRQALQPQYQRRPEDYSRRQEYEQQEESYYPREYAQEAYSYPEYEAVGNVQNAPRLYQNPYQSYPPRVSEPSLLPVSTCNVQEMERRREGSTHRYEEEERVRYEEDRTPRGRGRGRGRMEAPFILAPTARTPTVRQR